MSAQYLQNSVNRQGLLSCQTLGWYHNTVFGGEQDANAALAFIRDCGFDGIDYHFEGVYTATQIRSGVKSPVFDKTSEELQAYYLPLQKAMENQSIAITQAHGISPQYLPGNEEMNAYLHSVTVKTMEVCRFLNCPSLVLHPIRGLSQEENQRLFQSLISDALRNGVTICIENMFLRREDVNLPFFDAATACQMIDNLNASAGETVFGCCYDTGHANLTGRNIYEDICLLDHRLICLHIHENDGVHDQHLIPYTQQQPSTKSTYIDWNGLCRGLAQIAYNGPINFEVHPALRVAPPELTEDLLKLTATVGRHLHKCIQSTKTNAAI